MTTKIGVQDYKGIKIDYSREELLGDFAIATLKDRYLWDDEDHAAAVVWNMLCAMYTERKAHDVDAFPKEKQLDDRVKYPKD